MLMKMEVGEDPWSLRTYRFHHGILSQFGVFCENDVQSSSIPYRAVSSINEADTLETLAPNQVKVVGLESRARKTGTLEDRLINLPGSNT